MYKLFSSVLENFKNYKFFSLFLEFFVHITFLNFGTKFFSFDKDYGGDLLAFKIYDNNFDWNTK